MIYIVPYVGVYMYP